MTAFATVRIGALGRDVTVREGTSDRQVLADTFTGLYHVPPVEIAPATVLDLGANIGLTAAHYRVMWPDAHIVAVEMDADCAALAAVNAPGVTVQCQAVSGEGGWGAYNRHELIRAEAYSFEAGQGVPAPGNLPPSGWTVVSSYTLRQTILRSFPSGCADFVKVDVEGAEWGILDKPSWAPLVCCLLMELHPIDLMPNDSEWLVARALDMLRGAGFEAERFDRHPRAVWAWRE